MNQSASTAPDVMYEDTFKVMSDVDAGYLAPLDAYTKGWSDWGKFYDNAKSAGLGADARRTASRWGTDTRALWYNKDLFKKAGLPVPWAPKTWTDVLAAAKTIKAKLPGVTPLNVYSARGRARAPPCGLRDAPVRHQRHALQHRQEEVGSPVRGASATP